jgi:O-acetyl-ADP-ribose deacetylase (regulator of RNase III)
MTTFDYDALIDQLCDRVPKLRPLYAQKVRHYVIRTHTLNVCNQFERYFAPSFAGNDIAFFRKFLVLHDVGKPIAQARGDRSAQHDETTRILVEHQDALGISPEQVKWVRLLSGNDTLGEYMQGRKSLIEATSGIHALAENMFVSQSELLYLQTVYYQCDAGSYTADAGGLRFLEHLFQYRDGTKIFDPESQLLVFSEQYQAKYGALKRLLLNGEASSGMEFEVPPHITLITGNIFNSKCQTLVNTVNCVGVMGRGIALVHRLRHPAMNEQYKEYCRDGRISIGKLFLYTKTGTDPWILNFPTKDDWKKPSKIEFIEAGLKKFEETWKAKGITSIAFPVLGTHNGGLSLQEVMPVMISHLANCHLPIEIFNYAPDTDDGLFGIFKQYWMSLTQQEIQVASGIQPQYIRKLTSIIESGEVHSMIALANYEGIGLKTLEKAFALVRNSAPGNVCAQERLI